jgi:hypothetical protein
MSKAAEVYEGNFENGEKNGNGKLTNWSDGTVLEGTWKNNKKDGEFTQTTPQGERAKLVFEQGVLSKRIPMSPVPVPAEPKPTEHRSTAQDETLYN